MVYREYQILVSKKKWWSANVVLDAYKKKK
jgi:hypothetical protein